MRPNHGAISGIRSLALLGTNALAQNTIQLSVTSDIPDGASSSIDPSFAGFGIEPSNLFSFTGGEQANALTFNLINNLANYTGKPPHIRIGGNTADYMVYSADQTKWSYINNPSSVAKNGAYAPDSMLIGPRYFEAANRFPKGTPVTWGLNLAYQEDDWADRITTMAKQVIDTATNLDLVSFEVGNEPDLYLENGFRSGTWGGQVYTEQWLARVGAIYEQVLRPNNLTSASFEPGCTASTIGTTFEIDDLVSFGISAEANDSTVAYVTSWNQHDYYYYIGVSTYSLTMSHFLQLSTTEDQFTAWTQQIDQAHSTPYPYALREMGVVGPIGLEGITNTFGAALWTLNFLLYAATLNITTMQFHMTDNSNASAWQPIEMYGRQPFVRPLYYAYTAFDQVIGPTCTAQVVPVTLTSTPDGYDGYLKAYAVYQAGVWQSIVVINSKETDSGSTDLPSVSVKLAVSGTLASSTAYVAYLSNAASDSTSGTTWNNLDFEGSGDGTPRTTDDGLSGKTVQIASDGTITFDVRDSQAVVVNLGSKVGEGLEADQTACAKITARSPGLAGNILSTDNGTTSSSNNGSDSSSSSSSSNSSGTNGTPDSKENVAHGGRLWSSHERGEWLSIMCIMIFAVWFL